MADPARAGKRGEDNGGTQPPRATVLVVDDDAAVRDLLTEALRLHNYKVIAVATVQEAEEVKQRLGPQAISLVIADVRLTPQGQEGYELYQRWTAAHPRLRFLLVSGDPHSRTLPDIAAGTVPFLAKPFPMQALLDTVRAIVGR